MGYSKEHIEETRTRILLEAGRLMRKNGYSGVSINQIMAAANLTHGGFYAHFKSKDELFKAMIGEEFDFTVQLKKLIDNPALDGRNKALIAAEYYLDPATSDKVAPACTLASSTQDVARAGAGVKNVFTKKFKSLVATFQKASSDHADQSGAKAMAALATCVGGLIISRALNDGELAEQLLSACRETVKSLSSV